MRALGTPFAGAIVLSAAALLLLPDVQDEQVTRPVARPVASATALAAAVAPTATGSAPGPTTAPASPAQPLATPAPALAAGGTVRGLRNAPVQLNVKGFWAWALLDRRTGQLVGSPNLGTRTDTASMIKAWIAADFLRRATERGQGVNAYRLHELSIMIRDSDNNAASDLHRANGGAESIKRLSATCGLTDTVPNNVGSWSTTMMSPRDAARMGVCIATGRAAGPQWTAWLMNEMRQVRGAGRFGIIEALAPDVAATVAIKNGWIPRRDGKWHVNCMAVADGWALAVMSVYPASLGRGYGESICRQVTQQLGA
jgi:hypothetical protein